MENKKPENHLPTISDLKSVLHGDLSRLDQLLLVLSSFGTACQVRDINKRAEQVGVRGTTKWNPSNVLRRSNGLAIRTSDGWEITESGRQRLHALGLVQKTPDQVAHDLRAELANIADANTRAFADEAIKCHEARLYRSAIVMSWIAAVSVLHQYVVNNCLQQFNVEAKRVNARWKYAKTSDDLGSMKEADFLDRLVGISVIGKNVKAELKNCLDRRNGCGHPSSLQIGAQTSAHHIEVLLLNVFKPFS